MITELLEHLRANGSDIEIIVADCGSTDGTADLVDGLAKIVRSEKGRALQMNAGAGEAMGDVLWFLHADCRPPERSVDLINDVLEDPDVVGGGFRWGLSGTRWYYGICTAAAHVKNRIRRNLYGDMGIFVRRAVFDELGGYAEIPLFEDVEFNDRLRKVGRIVILDEVIYSSDRKLLEQGPIRAFIRNDILKAAYFLGFSPEFLKRYY